MDAQQKANRLQMIREAAQRVQDKEELVFAGIPVTKDDVRETMADMDTFREEQRDRRSNSEAINSDEA